MKNRITAFLVHSSLSFIVAALVIILVFWVWYPDPLQQAMGVTDIFLILLFVDVCLGPLITFVVYNPEKKHLFLDLAIIVCIQLAALGYGVHTIFQGRPAYIVFSVDRFETVSTPEISPESLTTAMNNNNKLAEPSWLAPLWVATSEADDTKRRTQILFASVMEGIDWPQLPELYKPLPELKLQILKKAKTIEELRKLHHGKVDIEAALEIPINDKVKWLPLKSKAKNMIILVDAQSAEVIKIVDIDPWP